MRKKTSTNIQLVLITSLLASCAQPQTTTDSRDVQKVYMRSDTTAPYTEVTNNYRHHSGSGFGTAFLWYMAFRHLGGGMGYANSNLHPSSVSGKNTAKANAYNNAVRGGFGSKAKSSGQTVGS